MKREILIEDIVLSLSEEGDNVRARSDEENVLLANQRIEKISELVEFNLNLVRSHYKLIMDREGGKIDLSDLNRVSLSIVLYYLYMYNSWRGMYKGQENRDLKFLDKDFNQASTHDILFQYFKTKSPEDWEEKCAVMLEMDLEELKTYYERRKLFYNM